MEKMNVTDKKEGDARCKASTEERGPTGDGRPFYRIRSRPDGLCDVWLTPGSAYPAENDLTGRINYGFHVLAVPGINPKDPQWGGNLEENIRRHYKDWIMSAEVITV